MDSGTRSVYTRQSSSGAIGGAADEFLLVWDFDRFVNRDYLGVGALIEDPSFQMSVASTLVPSHCRSHSMYRIFAGVWLSDLPLGSERMLKGRCAAARSRWTAADTRVRVG